MQLEHPAIERLSAYLEHELSEEDTAEVDSHLADCPACQAHLESLRHALDVLRALPELEAPPGFTERVMTRVDALERRRFRAFFLRWHLAPILAPVAAATLVVVMIRHPLSDKVPVPAIEHAEKAFEGTAAEPVLEVDRVEEKAESPRTSGDGTRNGPERAATRANGVASGGGAMRSGEPGMRGGGGDVLGGRIEGVGGEGAGGVGTQASRAGPEKTAALLDKEQARVKDEALPKGPTPQQVHGGAVSPETAPAPAPAATGRAEPQPLFAPQPAPPGEAGVLAARKRDLGKVELDRAAEAQERVPPAPDDGEGVLGDAVAGSFAPAPPIGDVQAVPPSARPAPGTHGWSLPRRKAKKAELRTEVPTAPAMAPQALESFQTAGKGEVAPALDATAQESATAGDVTWDDIFADEDATPLPARAEWEPSRARHSEAATATPPDAVVVLEYQPGLWRRVGHLLKSLGATAKPPRRYENGKVDIRAMLPPGAYPRLVDQLKAMGAAGATPLPAAGAGHRDVLIVINPPQ